MAEKILKFPKGGHEMPFRILSQLSFTIRSHLNSRFAQREKAKKGTIFWGRGGEWVVGQNVTGQNAPGQNVTDRTPHRQNVTG